MSGTIKWLLDIIAPSNALASRVMLAFGTIAAGQEVRIHPMISRLVDRSLIEQLKVAPAQAAQPEA